jgi:hypothetical protein
MMSRDAAEPLWGTAKYAERWLLIEYRGSWPAQVLKSGLLPPSMMAQLDALRRTYPSVHTLFIRQSRASAGRLRAVLIDCRDGVTSQQRVEFETYEELAAMDLPACWEGAKPAVPEPPLYLVCTHGTHDKCCAKFGQPVYNALAARYPDRVWEASHVGGHRFAANVLAFPTGACYGRVTPDTAVTVIEHDARGELDLAHYRGRVALPPNAQAAEYFLRTRLALPRVDALRFDRCTAMANDRWSVTFRATDTGVIHEAVIEQAAEPLSVLKDCEASAPEPVRAFALVDARIGETF